MFFIDIVELYNSVIKYYKQSLQTEGEKSKFKYINQIKACKKSNDKHIKNTMLMVSNLPTSYCHKNISKHLFEIWWMDLIPDLCLRYDLPFACIWLVTFTGYITVHLEKFGTGIHLLPIVQ